MDLRHTGQTLRHRDVGADAGAALQRDHGYRDGSTALATPTCHGESLTTIWLLPTGTAECARITGACGTASASGTITIRATTFGGIGRRIWTLSASGPDDSAGVTGSATVTVT